MISEWISQVQRESERACSQFCTDRNWNGNHSGKRKRSEFEDECRDSDPSFNWMETLPSEEFTEIAGLCTDITKSGN